MVWLVDSLSIGRLLVIADVESVCALFVANFAVALADFVGGGGSVSGLLFQKRWYRDGYLCSSYSSSIHGLGCRYLLLHTSCPHARRS
jgi:hypothetical protein